MEKKTGDKHKMIDVFEMPEFVEAKENIIIVAHRGACGGNIPCNTVASYEIALKQGADMIEVDVSCSRDGKLFLFHPGMEIAHLNKLKMLNLLLRLLRVKLQLLLLVDSSFR